MPSPGWKAPQIAALMRSEGQEKPPERDVISEHERALRAILAEAGDNALRQQVSASLEHASARVAAIDAELGTLARDASPGEIDRLTAQLENLHSRGGNGEQSELAALVQKQIEVVQRLRVRTELLADERRKIFALLRGLHAQVTLLREAADELATARVTSLCAEIDSLAR